MWTRNPAFKEKKPGFFVHRNSQFVVPRLGGAAPPKRGTTNYNLFEKERIL